MIAKAVNFLGQQCIVTCDGKCNKAWGINHRPRVQLSESDVDDFVFLADSELEEAPADPGTYEGGDAKPIFPEERLNKWCSRECERAKIVDPLEEFEFNDFSKRVYNQPSKHPEIQAT